MFQFRSNCYVPIRQLVKFLGAPLGCTLETFIGDDILEVQWCTVVLAVLGQLVVPLPAVLHLLHAGVASALAA